MDIWILTIMNSAIINIVYGYLFKYLLTILLGLYPGVELIGHMLILYLRTLFEELSDSFLKW